MDISRLPCYVRNANHLSWAINYLDMWRFLVALAALFLPLEVIVTTHQISDDLTLTTVTTITTLTILAWTTLTTVWPQGVTPVGLNCSNIRNATPGDFKHSTRNSRNKQTKATIIWWCLTSFPCLSKKVKMIIQFISFSHSDFHSSRWVKQSFPLLSRDNLKLDLRLSAEIISRVTSNRSCQKLTSKWRLQNSSTC